jgi:GT2 family glycosyltransferase/Tfp pilus assembly protein PilF/SAM-dependent methyltransferase
MISSYGDAYSQEWPELAQLVPEHALRILEVGCRTGALGGRLKQQRPQREVVGLEPDYEAAERARARLDKVFVGPIERTDLFYPDGYFDCILYPDILQRLVDPWVVLRRHRRLLSPAGLILARVPNLQHIQNLKKGLQVRPESGLNGHGETRLAGLPDRQCLRHFTSDDVQQLFFESGFEIELVQPESEQSVQSLRRKPDCKTLVLGRASIDLRGLSEKQSSQFLVPHFLVCARHRAEPVIPRRVSIVIPVCGQLQYTRQCLESLFAHTAAFHEVILVNNGSEDETAAYFQQLLDQWESLLEARAGNQPPRKPGDPLPLLASGDAVLRVITNSKNIGFPAAVNQGIQTATGEYILVLHNDTNLTAGWLEGLVRCAEIAPGAGIVGPASNCALPAQKDAQALYEGPDGLAEYAENVRQRRYGQWFDVPDVSGACLLIKRAVIVKIGAFDERFGPGLLADSDFCFRARKAGFHAFVAADVFIHHFGGRTFEALNIDTAALRRANEQKFQEKLREQPGNGAATRPDRPKTAETPPISALKALPAHGASEPDDYPSLTQALLEKGREAARAGQFDEALAVLEKAIEHAPDNAEAHNDLAWVCFRKGLNDRAERHWQKSLELAPSNMPARRNLADFYFNHERFAEAIALYEQLVLHEAADAEVVDTLGDAYFEVRNYEAAAMAYEMLSQAFQSADPEAPAVTRIKQKLHFARQRQRECLIV